MGKAQDLTGKKFNRLLVIKYSRTSNRKLYWECKCDCGNIVTVQGTGLKNDHTKSCGCLQREAARNAMNKVNETYNKVDLHGLSHTKTYRTWQSMISRCNNPNAGAYAKYGAKGITICDRWLDFKNFAEDMGGRPENTTLDRIDNEKGYYPQNCRWSTPKTQSINREVFKKSKSGYTGVVWHKRHNKWESYITLQRKKKHIGYYDDIEPAVKARNDYIKNNNLEDFRIQ